MPFNVPEIEDELREEWAKRLRAQRQKKKLSQAAAAGRVDVTFTTWSKWETGRHVPAEARRPQIAEALGTSVRSLFPPSVPA